jgi:ATP-binding cassette subfamily F protein uup
VYTLPGDGTLRHLPGGIDEYLALIAKDQVETVAGADRTASSATRTTAAGDARAASPAAGHAQVHRAARKELARLERTISQFERRETALHEELAAHATDHTRVAELDAKLREVQAAREAAETQWLEVAEQVG